LACQAQKAAVDGMYSSEVYPETHDPKLGAVADVFKEAASI